MTDVIRIEPQTGGSGTGISHYLGCVNCAKKVQLDQELVEKGLDMRRPNSAAVEGTFFHGMAELFYDCTDMKEILMCQSTEPGFGTELARAKNMFKHYIDVHPERDFWGDVFVTERQVPKDATEAGLIADGLGLLEGQELTARIDMVTQINQEQAERIEKRTGMLLAPGRYLLDHKTKSRKDDKLPLKYDASVQFTAYQIMWNLLHPEHPERQVKGMIANTVIATDAQRKGTRPFGVDSFFAYLVFAPRPHQVAGFRKWLQHAIAAKEQQEPNWAACASGWSVCQHFIVGDCR